MGLMDLPEEILIMIVKKLDIKSKCNFYNTCSYAQNISRIQGVVKEWNMSMNTLATVKTFKTDFFRDVAGYLQEVNMCGVVDLCKTAILPALKRMKNLKILDVSYTDIDLTDFIDMYAVCPTITTISINFVFDKPSAKDIDALIVKCQDVFKNMNNIHFVGTTVDLLYSELAQHILAKSNLNILKMTVIDRKPNSIMQNNRKLDNIVKFKELDVYFMNLEVDYGRFCDISMFQGITKFPYFEYIVMINGIFQYENEVYVTPIFSDFFRSRFGIKAKGFDEFNNELIGNMVIMIFNRECFKFDDIFFSKLYVKIKDYFPTHFSSDNQTSVQDHLDWFYTSPVVSAEIKNISSNAEMEFKKKRIANPIFVLNFDTAFKQKQKMMLSLSFIVNYVNPVSLSTNCDYLSKITFLSLTGTVRYSIEFFNLLFRCCTNMETFDIIAPSISPCVSPISRSLPLSKSLKNIRLIDRRFDYKSFFYSLSQCKTLENIHLLDRSSENTSLADPSTFFKNCVNLYNVCIKACMTNASKKKMSQVFNNAKNSLGMPHLCITLCQIFLTHDKDGLNYDPYVDVFNVHPIKPGFSWDNS